MKLEYDDIVLIKKGPHTGKHAHFRAILTGYIGTTFVVELLNGGNVMLTSDQFVLCNDYKA